MYDLRYESKIRQQEHLREAVSRRRAKLARAGRPTFIQRIASKVTGVFASKGDANVQKEEVRDRQPLVVTEDPA